MKLSRLEKRLLQFIDKQFPLAYDNAKADRILTKEELPLPTRAELTAAFSRLPADQLDSALRRLQAFQCIKKVYLYTNNDFSEISLHAGNSTRMPVAKKAEGVNGYQITRFGKDTLNGLISAKIKSLLSRWGEKFAWEYMRLVIAFVLGNLLSSLFGMNLWDLWNAGQ